MKVLIAEDELLVAKVLRIQFEKLGHEVRNVTTAGDAVNTAKEWKPELIVLDVQLKQNTCGIQAGEEIRNLGIQSPIIFTTGNSYEATLGQIKGFGKVDLLTKPVEFQGILNAYQQLHQG